MNALEKAILEALQPGMSVREAAVRKMRLRSIVGDEKYAELSRKGRLLPYVMSRCRTLSSTSPYLRNPFDPPRCITYNEFQHRVTHKCPYSEYNAAILLLLEAGVDLNVAKPRKSQGCFPETAMDIALMYADPDVAYTLRAAGAKYGYELCDNAEREKEEERRSSVDPIALPEPDEWFTTADVLAYARLCTRLCGLDDWQWKLKRGSYMGCCYYRSCTLALNPDYLHRSHLEIRATIIHELAHALAWHRAGHGPIWKLWGIALGLPGMRRRHASWFGPQKSGLLDVPVK